MTSKPAIEGGKPLSKDFLPFSRMKKLNVLHIVEDLKIGGVEELVRIVATGLNRDKYNVYVCCIEEGGQIAQELINSGINVDILGLKTYYNPLNILKLARYLKKKKIDIIHTHMYFANSFGRLVAILAKTPIIISTAYSSYFEYKRRNILMERFLSRFTDRIIAASNSIKEFTIKQQGILPEKIMVIYDCASTEKFSKNFDLALIKEKLNIEPDYAVVGCVARFVEVKGHAYLIQAAEKVLKKNPKVKFLLVGDGPLKEDLKALCVKLGIEKNIIFTGMRRDIPQILSVMDIFVLPSALREGCPLAILEAMAMSKPVIATDLGGIPEEVSDGKSGILVPSQNPDLMAGAIISLLLDQNKAREMGQAGRKIFEEKFSKEVMLGNIERLYDDIASKRLSKRILYVDIFGEVWGGGQFSLLSILASLDKAEFRPIVALPYEGDLSEKIRQLGLEVKIIPFGTVKTINIFAIISSILRFYLFIKIKKINLVHTNALRPTFYAGIAAKVAGVPLIWHARDLTVVMWIDRVLSAFSTSIVAISNIVAKRFPWLNKDNRLLVIYNGIDVEKFKPCLKNIKLMNEFNIDEDISVVGIVGHLEPRKGQEFFLRAAPKIVAKFPQVKFLLVGKDNIRKGAYQRELESLAEELGIKDKVIFSGYREDIQQVMSVIDIFVFPFKDEAFGRVVIEAMALAKPAIVYNHSALPEIIEDGKSGILLAPDDEEALVNSVVKLLNDSGLAAKLGKAARERVEQQFTLKLNIDKIQKLYHTILNK